MILEFTDAQWDGFAAQAITFTKTAFDETDNDKDWEDRECKFYSITYPNEHRVSFALVLSVMVKKYLSGNDHSVSQEIRWASDDVRLETRSGENFARRFISMIVHAEIDQMNQFERAASIEKYFYDKYVLGKYNDNEMIMWHSLLLAS